MIEQKVTFTQPKEKPGRLRLIIIIGALSAFGPLSIDMYLPGLPSLSKDLGGADWQVQLTLTACLLGLASGQILAGPLSDARGRYRPLLVGLLIYSLASLACALAPNIFVLILTRVLQGAAGSAGIVIARAMVRDMFSGDEVARFFAMTMAINGLAPILAPILGGQLLNFTSWRGIFIVLTAIGIVLFFTAALGLKETLPLENRHTGGILTTIGIFRKLLSDRIFIGYALSSGLAFGGMFAYIAGSPFVLEGIFGLSPQMFSLIFALNALGIVITSQISGRLVGKVKPRKLLGLGLNSALIGGLLLALVIVTNIGLGGVLPALFLVVASIGLIAPNATALAMAENAKIAGSASALIGVTQYIIGGLVTPLVSIGGSQTDLPWSLVIVVLVILANITFIIMTRPHPERIEN
ncbi:MAG: Bcr/CflA family multidrug efflux MFS transporter [Chloroflexi bacterium]|uniref:Bcr/CflA family multidrug efflux MFS transporter n=1 Tax=Candidatus Chlorohelix allophototropha TaxID=3003348 RepID=A0A8T7LXW8_9CHLR|nr:Bcr/CflA family multidrug efflux MFS transporter [Chloroflexota bacterium]WJW67688.1 Bcr/CflA family multidrug efflux MFS transporter [Chloroflexota bacterium L227-S17]